MLSRLSLQTGVYGSVGTVQTGPRWTTAEGGAYPSSGASVAAVEEGARWVIIANKVRLTQEEKERRQRQLEAIRKMDDDTLLIAYAYGNDDPNLDVGEPLVKAVLESRLLTRIFEETRELEKITDISRTEVKRLADSSIRMERLTKILAVLTILLFIIAGVQTWKMFQPERPIHIVVQPPSPTAPQTPTLSPR